MIDGPNLYAYVTNDPINYIDPMGTEKNKASYWNTSYTGKTGGKWDVLQATNLQSDNAFVNQIYAGINGTVGIVSYPVNMVNNLGGAVFFDAPAAAENFIVEHGGPDFMQMTLSAQGTPIPFDDAMAAGLLGLSRYSKSISTLKKGPVIIGETMSRVEEAASKIPGAKFLNDMPDFKAMGMNAEQVTSAMMKYNRTWILKQMRSGRKIVDIGVDVNRNRPSIFYEMERNMIRNYNKLHPEFTGAVSP